MEFIIQILFLMMLHFSENYAINSNGYLEPDKISTQIGASYVIMLKDDSASPVECYINDTKQTFSINLFQEGVAPVPIDNPQSKRKLSYLNQPRADTDVITSLGNGVCGFKMDSVSENTPRLWYISFIDQSKPKDIYSGELHVNIKRVLPRKTVTYKRVGAELTIYCANNNAGDLDRDIIYCKLFNPQNERIKLDRRSCQHTVSISKLSDFGVWRCEQSFGSHMLPTVVTHEFIPIETDVVHTWSNTTDKYLNIGCKVINSSYVGKGDYCVMTRPDGYEIVLSPGLATKRYTAIGTNFKNHICSMQIMLPLEEKEKGLWRCEERSEPFSPVGGYISVSEESSLYVAAPKVPKNTFVNINSTLKLTCTVPYSSPYCYMRGPDGFMYPLNDNRLNSLGICELSKEKAQLTDNGTWVCGFGKQTGEPDDVHTFEVYIPESTSIQSQIEEIEARSAGIARLICSTKGLGDYPLKYCRFLSPEGKIYQIGNHETSDRISYEGRGLEYGDCGIILQDVSESDQGTWSCITRVQKVSVLGSFEETKEIYTNIHLTVNDNLSLGSTLGISFGVAAVVIATLVFIAYRHRRRLNFIPNISSFYRRNSHSSDISNNDVSLYVHQDNTYSSTDVRNRNVSTPPDGNQDSQMS